MDEMPKNISSYINTDKKWLEENLLCLASNAVKFQFEGTVTIRCKVTDRGHVRKSFSTSSAAFTGASAGSYDGKIEAIQDCMYIYYIYYHCQSIVCIIYLLFHDYLFRDNKSLDNVCAILQNNLFLCLA